VTILISTSYLDEAERCHRVGLLHHGRLLLCDAPEALKRGLRGALVAVTSPDPRAARNALARAEGVSTAVLVGDGVHLVVDDGPRRIPELGAILAAAGVPFDDISQSAPSIEDLFVSVVRRESGGTPS
jgi:ABC-2 type transport system ATP-binding protein